MSNSLPSTWAIVSLLDVAPLVPTGVPNFTGEVEYYSTGSVQEGGLSPEGRYTFESRPSRANRWTKPGDVLQARMQGTSKPLLVNAIIADKLFSTGFIQLRPDPRFCNPGFLRHYIASKVFLDDRDSLATGSTQIALTDAGVRKLEIPLAPLNEQRRIAAKIDILLGKVYECQKRLAKISMILKRFRQSVLAAACSGRLTAAWREEGGLELEGWTEAVLKDVAQLRLGKMLDKAKNIGKPTRYLRNLNVRWFSFDLSDLAKMRATPQERKELGITDGDLLVCEGGEPGRCAIWNLGPSDLIFQKAVHRIRVKHNVTTHWVALNIRNDANSGRLEDYFTGTTIKHLTGKALATYRFPLPPLTEQHEIVRRVESMLKLADAVEKRVAVAKWRAEKLTQAILAKAFRGELVPTEAELARREGRPYESASELLARIKSDGESKGGSKSVNRIRRSQRRLK